MHRQVFDERLKLIVLRNEVSFTCDLNEDSNPAAMNIVANPPLLSGAIGLLRRNLGILLADEYFRLIHITVAVFQRILACHHACAGLTPQFGHHLGGNISHRSYPLTPRNPCSSS